MDDNTPANDDLKMLDMTDICELLCIGKRTLQTWRQNGQFPSPDLSIGKTVRWRRSTVKGWIEKQTIKATCDT